MKSKYVYHGTSNGNIKEFEPRKPSSKGNNPTHNLHKGVYATNEKRRAILMGIFSGSGVKDSSTWSRKNKPTKGYIHEGRPRHKYLYVYSFPIEKFKNIPKGSGQYIYFEKIKPIRKEKFEVKDYMKWVKFMSNKEARKNWEVKND